MEILPLNQKNFSSRCRFVQISRNGVATSGLLDKYVAARNTVPVKMTTIRWGRIGLALVSLSSVIGGLVAIFH